MMTQENISYIADEIKAMVKTCEKYNKALERASKLRVQNSFDTVGQMVEHIFPELQESEDELTRKSLIRFLRSPFVHENITDEKVAPWLAWLEKQGEKNINHTEIKEKAHQIAWETSKDYDPSLSKEACCEMAALDMASWLVLD